MSFVELGRAGRNEVDSMAGTQTALSPQPSFFSLYSKVSSRIPHPHPDCQDLALSSAIDLLGSGPAFATEAA